jgi:Tol biopolymer transport system component
MLAIPSAVAGMAALIALAVGGADGATAHALARGPQGTLVFSSDRSGTSQIYSIRADGSRLGQLTRGKAADAAPLFSPDGRRIVFFRNESQLWVMNADGSRQRKLASSGVEPAWSPDSRRIVYVADSKLVVARAEGKPRVVARGGSSRPYWSPDGRLLAFSREVGDRTDLAVVRGDGRGLRTVRRNADLLGWSPRGEIAFVGKDGGAVSLVGANGRHARRLLRSAPSVLVWSPDGRRLAFVDREGLHVASATGRSIRRLQPKGVGSPAWSPDSHWLAVASEHDVFLVAVDGSSLRHLTARLPRPWGGAGYGAATWRPKGATSARLGRRPVPPLPSETASAREFRPGSGEISDLAADGGLAAIIFTAKPCVDAGVEAWQPARHRFARLAREGCGENGVRYQPAHGLAVAGAHVAWLQVNGGNDLETSVVTATLGGDAPVDLGVETADGSDLGDIAGEPVGGDGLLVFTVSYRCDHDPYDSNCPPGRKTGDLAHATIWRLGGRMRCGGDESGPRRCTKVAQADGELTVLAAGSGRIAARTDQGVRVLTAAGKVVRDLPVAAKAAAVSGTQLAIRTADAVEVWDTGSGQRNARFPVPKAVTLQDLGGDILVTASGKTVTLRKLGNGHTAVFGTVGPAKAALEEPGLYLAGTRRVTFTPMREVLRRLGS